MAFPFSGYNRGMESHPSALKVAVLLQSKQELRLQADFQDWADGLIRAQLDDLSIHSLSASPYRQALNAPILDSQPGVQ